MYGIGTNMTIPIDRLPVKLNIIKASHNLTFMDYLYLKLFLYYKEIGTKILDFKLLMTSNFAYP
jgi:hypothetical protein